RTDQVESSWRFCTTILEAWNRPGAPPPLPYAAGTWGPEAADDLMSGEMQWRRL
ncbi:MAG: glucose-6-phosphate dehydrogenase, partial [Singulisphaera sp.]|nr:glucose-6-phosphate dehydrogenase [Singulisphaera sp.]